MTGTGSDLNEQRPPGVIVCAKTAGRAPLLPLCALRRLPVSRLTFSFAEKAITSGWVSTFTIHDLDNHVLAFDLRDLLHALAPTSLAAKWTIKQPDASPFEATGAGGVRLEELAEVSAQINGNELLLIADATVQVIWGDFVAVLSDHPHRKWLTIRAVDSSYFELETSDAAAIAAIKSRFLDVRNQV